MRKDILNINEKLRKDTAAFIRDSDKEYNEKILEIAEDIINLKGSKPIILLSGPSGSGKTTTALTLEKCLDERGHNTHTLSLDNYFLPVKNEEKILLEEGKLDLETPLRVDKEFLNSQLKDIIDCKPVELSKYDFKNADRVMTGNILERKEDELVILEGVHALNPDVITVPDDRTVRIYVSVRTRVCAGDFVLHPSNIRLMRRMLRDRLYRARSVEDTLKMFESVEKGAVKYIMPYKSRSSYDVDTFIDYEINVYKDILESDLKELKDNEHIEKILKIFSAAEGVEKDNVPTSSLIREFIGEGDFEY